MSSAVKTGRTAAVPFSRLVLTELRKLVNTRTGSWLVIGMVALCVGMTVAMVTTGGAEHLSFQNIWGMMNLPLSFLLPVLAILLVTSEWSHRTTLVTFGLEPRRTRVLAAKLSTSVILTLVLVTVTAAIAAVGTVVALLVRDGSPGWVLSGDVLRNLLLLQFAHILLGFAFGLLIRSSAVAIVAYFALPTAWNLLGSLWPWVHDHAQRWIDFTAAQAVFQNGEAPFQSLAAISSAQWAQLAVATALWVLLPLAVGSRQVLRAEIK